MADGSENKMALHIDKIAYGAGGVFGLVVLVLAFMSGGELAGLRKDIEGVKAGVEDARSARLPEREIPNIERVLRTQWPDTVKVRTATPEWGVERIPGFVLFEEGPGTSYAQHPAPVITELKCIRSTKKFRVGVALTAELPERSNADLVGLKLLRKDDEGDFEELERFASKVDLEQIAEMGEIKFIDGRVRPGKTYTYKLVSMAELASGAKSHIQMPEDEKVKESNECTLPGPIPFDVFVRIVTARPFDPATGKEAHFIGTIYLASTEPGADFVEIKPASGQSFERGYSFGPKIVRGKPLFEVSKIDTNLVTIRNRGTKKSKTFKPSQEPPPLTLPDTTDCSDSGGGDEGEDDMGAEGAAGDDEDESEDDKGDAAADEDAEEKPKPKKKKKKSGGGGFR